MRIARFTHNDVPQYAFVQTDKNDGKDKNQSIAATGTSIVPVGVLAVSMMAAGCALTWRKRRES